MKNSSEVRYILNNLEALLFTLSTATDEASTSNKSRTSLPLLRITKAGRDTRLGYKRGTEVPSAKVDS